MMVMMTAVSSSPVLAQTVTLADGSGPAIGPCTQKNVDQIDRFAFAAATGAGAGGVPALSYEMPDGHRRMMIAVVAVERDHAPFDGRGDNYAGTTPLTGNTADAPALSYGGVPMGLFTYGYAHAGINSNDFSTAEISHELYVYYLWGASAPSGTNSFSLGANFNLPQNAGDEAVVMATTFDNVFSIEYIGNVNDSTGPHSIDIASDPAAAGLIQPAGTSAADNMLVGWGISAGDGRVTFGSGWTENAQIQAPNTNGTYATAAGRSANGPYSENDGLSVFVQSITGVTSPQSARFTAPEADLYDLLGQSVRFIAAGCDTGDAPASYGFAYNKQNPYRYLGALAGDADIIDHAGTAATGDDADGFADEDGIAAFPTLSYGDTAYTLTASDIVVNAGSGNLYGWIDFDGSGTFEASEFAATAVSGNTLTAPLTFSGFAPVTALGSTFARFRITGSSLTAADFAGDGGSGEVEDHEVAIEGGVFTDHSDGPADGGTAPNGTGIFAYGTASHTVTAGIRLGATITDETGPVEDADDASDDGAGFPALAQGTRVSVPVAVTGFGYLNAWIDFDGSGTFDSPVEQVAVDLLDADGDGTILLDLDIPDWSRTGSTHARLRWSSSPAIGPAGAADDGEVEDYVVTIADPAAIEVSGTVFLDNGAGASAGTAHDGIRDAGEGAGAYATVSVFETAGDTLIATAIVRPDGSWAAILPGGFGGEVRVVATPLGGYLPVSDDPGAASAPVNPSPTDGIVAFSVTAGTPVDGIDFGLVAEPSLASDQTATLAAGQIVDMPHRYKATTTGTVTFTLTDAVANPADTFGAALYADADCDGAPDSAITGAVAVVAGQSICVIVRSQASSGVQDGADFRYALTATTDFTGTGLTLVLRNDDRIIAGSSDVLQLTKRVTNLTAGTPESTSNSGSPGDVLAYRLVIVNPGSLPLTDITVSDTVPPFTALSAPVADNVVITPGVTCALSEPTSYVTGYDRDIRWTCPGSFPAGGEASLGFEVRILP